MPVVLAAAALVLTACDAAVVLDVRLDGDGSGRVTVRVEADRAAVAAIDRAVDEAAADSDLAVGNPLDAFAATVRRLPGWELTDRVTDDGGRVVAAGTDVGGPGELERVTRQLSGALTGADGQLLGPVSVSVASQRIRLDGELAADVDPAAALGWSGQDRELRWDGQPLAQALAGDDAPVSVRLTATMPGPVLDSDADTQQGQRLTWHAELDRVRHVHAVAQRPLPTRRPWLVGGVAAGVAVLAGLGAVWWWRRRK